MWPTWSKVYTAMIATPMIFLSLGIALWIVRTNLGGSLDESVGSTGTITVAVFMLAFVFTAWLFALAVQRVLTEKPEALVFAATGHLMLSIPAMVFSVIAFVQNDTLYLAELQNAVEALEPTSEAVLLLWMLFHAYMGLFLAMADNTSPLEAQPTDQKRK